jgi:D-alanine-D-alanine ligase
MEAADSDGSIVSVDDAAASTADEVTSAVVRFRSIIPNASFLMQEHLAGREYSVGIIGNLASGVNVLPILEVETECAELDRSRSVIPYPSRRETGAPIAGLPRYREARLSTVIRRRLVEYTTTLFERLRCRDYARVDFRADHLGEIKLQAVEPNPDWRWDGKLAAMSRFQGLQYAGMLRTILVTAMARAVQIEEPRRASIASERARPDFSKPRTALRTISA